MQMPSKEEAQARFDELWPLIQAAKAKIVPLREKHDAFVNEFKNPKKEAELFAPILKIGEDIGNGMSLFDAENELAVCARLMGGRLRIS